jgi:hypothetical protein
MFVALEDDIAIPLPSEQPDKKRDKAKQ